MVWITYLNILYLFIRLLNSIVSQTYSPVPAHDLPLFTRSIRDKSDFVNYWSEERAYDVFVGEMSGSFPASLLNGLEINSCRTRPEYLVPSISKCICTKIDQNAAACFGFLLAFHCFPPLHSSPGTRTRIWITRTAPRTLGDPVYEKGYLQ